MESMRQRTLLITGWVVAAAFTSLVSSAAVAIAGGQVTDRPLRPLSAAEVEALPGRLVPNPVPPPANPPPGFTPRNVEADEDVGIKDPTVLDPTAPDGEPLPFTGIDSRDPVDVGPPGTSDRSAAEIVAVSGGTVSVAGSDGEVYLLWAFPRPGYFQDKERRSPGELVVAFSNGRFLSEVLVTWDDDGLRVDTYESAR
jgi:hypothetical protein